MAIRELVEYSVIGMDLEFAMTCFMSVDWNYGLDDIIFSLSI